MPIPKVRDVSQTEVHENYNRIKEEVRMIIETEMERIYNTPELTHFAYSKGRVEQGPPLYR